MIGSFLITARDMNEVHMPALYVVEEGSRVEKEYQRILVTKEDQILQRVPLSKVSEVVLVGSSAGVTTQALHALLEANVPFFIVRRSGELLGRLTPPACPNYELRMRQVQLSSQDAFCLPLSRLIVSAKLHNQRVLMQRFMRRRKDPQTDAIRDIRTLEQAAQNADDFSSLLGFEGAAAHCYFDLFEQWVDPEWGFHQRERRPPPDPINSLLSLGYSLLSNALETALEICGLDPYFGVYHREKYGKPALALDLEEEFRTPVVDSLVLSLINRSYFEPDDFELEGSSAKPAVFLKTRALKLFLHEFGKKLEQPVKIAGVERPLSYRKIFEVQARKMARTFIGEIDTYQPFRSR